MLDVSRHFFTKAEVETLLDAMALHKLNMFHWHLTDDQGWRIEIKKYPKLTEVGAWRAGVGFGFAPNTTTAYGPDGRYGGFYTQDDIRDVVKYAAARHITIVPEIEMPGHATAALSAYPQFGCTGGPFDPPNDWRRFSTAFMTRPRRQRLNSWPTCWRRWRNCFPVNYIHIGGDEVPEGHLEKQRGLPGADEARRIEERGGIAELVHPAHRKNRQRARALHDWLERNSAGRPGAKMPRSWTGSAARRKPRAPATTW